MKPRELKDHKSHKKRLTTAPNFQPLVKKGNKLPKPLDSLGRRRDVHCSGVIRVSDSHVACFLYRGGEILTDRAFYAYLFCELESGSLYPLYEFHWHPSHKGIHCKLPCKTDLNYSGRLLVQAPELQLEQFSTLDPLDEKDRHKLIEMFCSKCGIDLELLDEITVLPEPDPQMDFFR